MAKTVTEFRFPDVGNLFSEIRAYLDAGLTVWGGGIGCRKEGDFYVIRRADEWGEEFVHPFVHAGEAVWELFQWSYGAVMTVTDQREEK